MCSWSSPLNGGLGDPSVLVTSVRTNLLGINAEPTWPPIPSPMATLPKARVLGITDAMEPIVIAASDKVASPNFAVSRPLVLAINDSLSVTNDVAPYRPSIAAPAFGNRLKVL